MLCPRCPDVRLTDDTLRRCPRCHGAWLDESAIADRIARAHNQRTPDLAWATDARKALPCASCAQPMQTVKLFDVALDRCTEHGVWFDANELDEVVKRSKPEDETESTMLDTVLDLFWRH
jgi:Zn-finger nucleic acid-binding protein